MADSVVLSMIGIALVTDPLERLNVESVGDGEPLSDHGGGGHLPNSLVSKLIGLIICIPSMFGQAAERESSGLFELFHPPPADCTVVSMRLVGDQATSAQMMVYLAFCPATVAAGCVGCRRVLFGIQLIN